MNFVETEIKDVKIIEPKVFGDSRGFFYESFNEKKFIDETKQNIIFCQDNHSKSSRGVLRGLHFQRNPYAQGKLVRCIAGSVFDVAVDIRIDSPSYGKYVSVVLSAENKKQLWIPAGFAHGFLTLEDNTEFVYKTTNYYHPESEGCIVWNDKQLNINWPVIGEIKLSDKDNLGMTLAQYIEEFN
ncbi:dTDP-4-dehydrorhamnose 3,5-epimerase [Enterobacteriaceae bacterium H20N1]|uniref:dTDP-4-dehydrorhamnose 3,5-epimerase n=1 Tax=Dryocola boscaweniae TaxID=2925397 RepID=A0A9X3AD67_9ENTR|nr:dTDP-4-dehydrorhamnose 3,5-epimerase [Dryocola boscaweniae]MCT4702588.1 dTDP-4-dehydrorhamnose 3,5-epimerase [Dryocola boscaweniae]MCT4719756.1 dTDP-4-dehydrorhamnose 3,5-epimerase [Dryocola boscaweniae]